MKKLKHANKTVVTSFTLTPELVKWIDEILETDASMLSRSDVVRSAIKELYRKERPPYLFNRSGSDIIKRETIKRVKNYSELTDREYAASIPGTIFITNKYGEEIVFIMGFINAVGLIGVSVNNFKQHEKTEPYWFNNIHWHEQAVAEGKKAEELLQKPEVLYDLSANYGIDREQIVAAFPDISLPDPNNIPV